MNTGFQRRRDPKFVLDSDPCFTAVGAPVALTRNPAGYSSIGRQHRGRWGAWGCRDTAFTTTSKFLQDHDDICVPMEMLTEIVQEDSDLTNTVRNQDLPDHLCGDLSWPGTCLEDVTTTSGLLENLSAPGFPVVVHAAGRANGDLGLLHLRPWWDLNEHLESRTGRNSSDESTCKIEDPVETNGSEVPKISAAVGQEVRLALESGPIRQISSVLPTIGRYPQLFARCDYSATLVELRGSISSSHPGDGSSFLESASEAAEPKFVFDGHGNCETSSSTLRTAERLVFSRRLTCTACSPFTTAHAAFLDEDFRLFCWHADRGAVLHGPGPLEFSSSLPSVIHEGTKAAVRARRLRDASVALEYAHHPRVLWMACQHQVYRVDLREPPSSAALAPALDPGVYYIFTSNSSIVNSGCGGSLERNPPPKIRALTVGRRSVHEVFVGAGLHLACMDDRMPKDVVARWDLPQEVDQLRWLPGLPGEGVDAEEIILASAGNSRGFFVNTWGKGMPRWPGLQMRLGLDSTSIAASAARRPLTFALPAPPLTGGETRSGALFVNFLRDKGLERAGNGLCLVYATSAGDIYGQRLAVCRTDGEREHHDEEPTVASIHRNPLIARRIQSMLPCGDLCVDSDAAVDLWGCSLGKKNDSSTFSDVKVEVNLFGCPGEPDEGGGESVSSENENISLKQVGTRQCTSVRKRQRTDSSSMRTDYPRPALPGLSTGRTIAGGDASSDGSRIEHFPLSAGALRAAIAPVPRAERSDSRRFPPLLKLVTEGKEDGSEGNREVDGTAGAATRQRRAALQDLRRRRDDVEEFLSLPKTPMELLIFCRKNLELNLPGDPVGSGDDKKSTDGDSWRNSADDIDDERAADDVARMVLSWGAPFRKIDTRWRVPVSSRVLTVASEATRGDEPLIGNVVLCSSREIARGASHPILEPGTSGPSFTVDFSAEDVRWLKDQWN